MKITVVIPAFNEEISIGSIVLKTKKYSDQIIVIDDGSVDKTAMIAKLAGAKIIRHHKNMGKGEALKTGFNVASQNGTEIIVTINADGQHDPDEIPNVIAPILSKEADMVIGSRYLNGNNRAGQIFLDRLTNINSRIKIADTQSGFRAFSVNALKLFHFRKNGFSIESEMLAEVARTGLKIKEVDIGVRYVVDCSTQNSLYHRVNLLVDILQEMEFRNPSNYIIVPGLIFGTIGLGMGLNYLQVFYQGGSLHFRPILMMILMTLVGLFMAFSGVILHYMSKMIERKKSDI